MPNHYTSRGRRYNRNPYSPSQDYDWEERRRARSYGPQDFEYSHQYSDDEGVNRSYYDVGLNRGDYDRGVNPDTRYRGNPDYRNPDWRYQNDYRSQNRWDYSQDYGEDYDQPETWTYEEWWIVPGPFAGVGPRGYQRSDDRIFEDVCDRLSQHGQVDASDMDVSVNNGEVTLTGTVQNRREKRLAEDAIESIPGVVDVHNQLRMQNRQSEMSSNPEQQRQSSGR